MGISIFSRNCSVYQSSSSMSAPNPSPINFEVLSTLQIGEMLIAEIKYLDCTNFEGIKICVFDGTTCDELLDRQEIDPHFSEDKSSPIARFKPTRYGLSLAIKLVESLCVNQGASK